MLRTMQKARYDSMNVGHFGLAAETYTHFTSPIRRYPDLVVHRLLRELRHTKVSDERKAELDEDLPEVGRHTSERERRAAEAEREILQWKKVRFMADKVGDVFDGYITGVAAFGMFVELVDHYVEGLVHVSTMADDYYRFREQSHALFGENTKKTYAPRRSRAGADRPRRHGAAADRPRPRRRARQGAARRAQPRADAQLGAAEERSAQGNAGAAAPREEAAARQERAQDQEAPMTNLVVGTAGHIDHGKSTLVRALTGIDPDRLKEEKARGITIELGFAHTTIGDVRVAFVDVPGHERFVRTMLAGVGGIDCVMLIVASDESVMPQTREHFDICRLLHIPRGIVVLTKADASDDDTRALVRQDVADLVKGSFLEHAPVVEVSANTGEGLDALRAAIAANAGLIGRRPLDGAARLPIDRAFTMKGFGTVVTGTLVSGRIARRRRPGAAARRPRREGARHPGARHAGRGRRGRTTDGDQPWRRRGRRHRARPDAGDARQRQRHAARRRGGRAAAIRQSASTWGARPRAQRHQRDSGPRLDCRAVGDRDRRREDERSSACGSSNRRCSRGATASSFGRTRRRSRSAAAACWIRRRPDPACARQKGFASLERLSIRRRASSRRSRR